MKNILISLAGLTPQVITETLYYLTQLHSPPVEISEIFILTTSLGKEKIISSLLDSHDGKYFALLEDYKIDASTIQFDDSHIIVLKDQKGNELQDIRTHSDNEAVADKILSFVREKTNDSQGRLHCSLAGGRKTMGLYLGFALQLYGRQGDVLSHVLVYPPEIEKSPDFFYPPPNNQAFKLNDGTFLKSEKIKVELAEIPVLFLREQIPLLKNSADLGYNELVNLTQKEFERLEYPLPLTINLASQSINIGEEVHIQLSPLRFAIYLFLARRRLTICQSPDCRGCEKCFFSPNELYQDSTVNQLKSILKEIGATDPRYELNAWEKDPIARFRQERSKINNEIRNATFGISWLDYYTIENLPSSSWGGTYYGIRLDKKLIKIS